jgi:hypothetical protein
MKKMDYYGSTQILDLTNPVRTNAFYSSGSGAVFLNCPLIQDCSVGGNNLSALYLKATATHNASQSEYMATFDCILNSGMGGIPIGPNSFSDARVCQFISSVTGPNSGAGIWAQAVDLVIMPNDNGPFRTTTELDINNQGTDCAPGGRNCYDLYLSGLITNPITSYLAISAGDNALTPPGSHYGILINGARTAKDVDIENSGGAAIGICNGCLTPQSHSESAFEDRSTSPVGLYLRGTYSMDAISVPGFSVNGTGAPGQIGIYATTAPPAGGFMVQSISNLSGFGIYISNGTPSVGAANGSINLDTTGKLWLHTGGNWVQVTVP